jgi:hypothetical protein
VRQSTVQNCSPFKLAPKPFLNRQIAYSRPLRVISIGCADLPAFPLYPFKADIRRSPEFVGVGQTQTSNMQEKEPLESGLSTNQGRAFEQR